MSKTEVLQMNEQTDTQKEKKQPHILVVDDSAQIVQHLTRNLLPSFGYCASYAMDGRTALAKIKAEKPDLVLLDLNLPEMSGLDVLNALANEAERPAIVLMTGGGSEKSAIHAFRLGIVDYLVKPFTSDEVRDTIQRSLGDLNGMREHHAIAPSASDQLLVAYQEIRHQQYRLENIQTIQGDITAQTNTLDIVEKVLRLMRSYCETDQCLMWILDPDTSLLKTYSLGKGDDQIQLHPLPVRNEFVVSVLGGTQMIRDSNFTSGFEVGFEKRARAIIYASVTREGRLLAVLGVHNLFLPNIFSEEQKYYLNVITQSTGIALRNAGIIRQTQQRAQDYLRELDTVTRISAATTDERDGKTLLRKALAEIFNSRHVEACSLWLKYEESGHICLVDRINRSALTMNTIANSCLTLGDGFVGKAAQSGKYIMNNEVAQHPQHYSDIDNETGFRTRSLLCMPLIYRDRVVGVIQLLNKMDGEFNDEDVSRLRAESATLALAVYHSGLMPDSEEAVSSVA